MMLRDRRILGVSCVAIATVMAVSPAQAQRVVRVDIKAQPLGPALRLLGRQMHVQMVFDETLLADRVSPTISGSMTPDVAIDRLLQGSGLVTSRTGQASM